MKKYEAVAAALRDDVRHRAPGSELPSRKVLAEYYDVAVNTIAHAFDILRSEGWIETAQGARTVVLAAPEPGVTLEEVVKRVARLEGRVDSIERRQP